MLKAARLLIPMISMMFVALSVGLASAEEDGSRIIRFSGALAEGQSSTVTVKQIEQAGLQEFTVFNPYEEREEDYTGVFISDLVEMFGAEGVQSVRLTALDDYVIDINQEEWSNLRIVLATRVDGAYFGFETKGPMRIVFPDYDSDKLEHQELLPKWIWMITRIEFKD